MPVVSADSPGGLGSVDNALRLLELLGQRPSIRVTDAADHLGVARSTAHRLLTALMRRDFVVQDAAKVYHRGPAFVGAGFGSDRVPLLRAAVRPNIEALAASVEETCHLVVLEGNGARFLDVVESPRVLRVGSRLGMLLPAHTTAAGKALLAQLSPSDFFALYPRGLPGMRAELARRTALQRELGLVRRRGYATNFDESEHGVTAVAVRLDDADGVAIAAIAVACPSARCPKSRVEPLAEALHEAAARSATTLHGFVTTTTPATSPGLSPRAT